MYNTASVDLVLNLKQINIPSLDNSTESGEISIPQRVYSQRAIRPYIEQFMKRIEQFPEEGIEEEIFSNLKHLADFFPKFLEEDYINQGLILLASLYSFKDSNVEQFLTSHSFLISLLYEAHKKINDFFKNSQLELTVTKEPESEEDKLVLFIVTDLSPEEALQRLNDFDHSWWLSKLPEAKDKLLIHVRFK